MKELVPEKLSSLKSDKYDIFGILLEIMFRLMNEAIHSDAYEEMIDPCLDNEVLDIQLDGELLSNVICNYENSTMMEQLVPFEARSLRDISNIDRFSLSRNYNAKYEASKETKRMMKNCSNLLPNTQIKFQKVLKEQQETRKKISQLKKQQFTPIDFSENVNIDERMYEVLNEIRKLQEKASKTSEKALYAIKKKEMIEQKVNKLRKTVNDLNILESDHDESATRRPLEVGLYLSHELPLDLEKKVHHRPETQ